jgi:hypothetical protein
MSEVVEKPYEEERGPEPLVPATGQDGEARRLRAGAGDFCHPPLRVCDLGAHQPTSTPASRATGHQTPTFPLLIPESF